MYKSDHNLSEKKRGQGFCLHTLFNYEINSSGPNSRNWAGHRSNATCSHHYLFHVPELFFWLWLSMGDELGGATVVDRLRVCSGLSTPIFSLIGDDFFSNCHTDFRPKMSRKNGFFFSFFGYLGEIESDSQTVWTGICSIVPRSVLPNFQVLICSGWRDSTLRTLSAFRLVQLGLYLFGHVKPADS